MLSSFCAAASHQIEADDSAIHWYYQYHLQYILDVANAAVVLNWTELHVTKYVTAIPQNVGCA
jgi:hypothetical protein